LARLPGLTERYLNSGNAQTHITFVKITFTTIRNLRLTESLSELVWVHCNADD